MSLPRRTRIRPEFRSRIVALAKQMVAEATHVYVDLGVPFDEIVRVIHEVLTEEGVPIDDTDEPPTA